MKAPNNVTYMLTLSNGKALLVSSPADEKFTDSGTYVFTDGVFAAFAFPKLGRFARNAKGGVENGVLTVPVRLHSGGSGTSTWRSLSQQSAEQQESFDSLLDNIFRAYDRRLSPRAKGNLLLFGLTMRESVGTSLMVIAVLAVPTLAAHWSLGHVDWRVAGAFALGAVPASALSGRYAHLVAGPKVRRAFGWFLIAAGTAFVVFRLTTG
jgi:hypothetical protein